jgi:hypothetical protein
LNISLSERVDPPGGILEFQAASRNRLHSTLANTGCGLPHRLSNEDCGTMTLMVERKLR